MPNWCDNKLIVSGNKKDVDELVAFVIERPKNPLDDVSPNANPLSCESIMPAPKDIGEGWYEWNIGNWGSKWDTCETNYTRSADTECWYTFQTAWSPIIPVIEALAKKYPQLSFTYRYAEGGNDFYGSREYEDGELTHEEDGELSRASCEVFQEYWGGSHHECKDCEDYHDCGEFSIEDECCLGCLEERQKEPENEEELWDIETEQNNENNLISR